MVGGDAKECSMKTEITTVKTYKVLISKEDIIAKFRLPQDSIIRMYEHDGQYWDITEDNPITVIYSESWDG